MTGREVGFVPVPDDAALARFTAADVPEWFAANLVTLFGLPCEGAAAEVTGGVRALTGREPGRSPGSCAGLAAVFG